MILANDPVLQRFRRELDKLFGARVERVILFGSRARGQEHADSDYDVAVFLKDVNQSQDMKKLSDAEFDIMSETGKHIHAFYFGENAYNDCTLFMHEIRKDGVELA